MSLALTCTSCARKLRLNDRLAGKRIKCPTCQTVLLAPQPTPTVTDNSPTTPHIRAPRESDSVFVLDALPPLGDSGEAVEPAYASGELWRMKTVEGDYYGPVSRQELDNWFHDGRIDAQCLLLRVGTNQWQNADAIYPVLASISASGLLPFPRDSGSQLDAQIGAPLGEQGGEQARGEVGAPQSEQPGERRNGHPWSENLEHPSTDHPLSSSDSGDKSDADDDTGRVAVRAKQRVKAMVAAERRIELRSGSSARPGESAELQPPTTAPDAAKLSDRSRLVAGLLALFVGTLGMHRIYLGYVVIGLVQLVTLGGCGIWALVDAIRIFLGRVPDATGRRLRP